jgi:gamma-glutamylcyclotransferase (GGCT)/AIG2-like uncharacterized protein YtfP
MHAGVVVPSQHRHARAPFRERANPTKTEEIHTMPYIFVYGTLRAGEANDIRLAAERNEIAAPRLVGMSALPGRLYDFGTYPGLVIDETGIPVIGEVYEIHDALVPIVDEIERIYPGDNKLFPANEVALEIGGESLMCRFYPVEPFSVQGKAEIPGGDWIAYRSARSGNVDRPAGGRPE